MNVSPIWDGGDIRARTREAKMSIDALVGFYLKVGLPEAKKDDLRESLLRVGITNLSLQQHVTHNHFMSLGLPTHQARWLAVMGSEMTFCEMRGPVQMSDPLELLAVLNNLSRYPADKVWAAEKLDDMGRQVIVIQDGDKWQLNIEATLYYWSNRKQFERMWQRMRPQDARKSLVWYKGQEAGLLWPCELFPDPEVVELDPFDLAVHGDFTVLADGVNPIDGSDWSQVPLERRALFYAHVKWSGTGIAHQYIAPGLKEEVISAALQTEIPTGWRTMHVRLLERGMMADALAEVRMTMGERRSKLHRFGRI